MIFAILRSMLFSEMNGEMSSIRKKKILQKQVKTVIVGFFLPRASAAIEYVEKRTERYAKM